MQPDFIQILALALLPAAGNLAGGLFAEFARPSGSALNRALHMASGILVGVVAVEVMPQALEAAPAWLLAMAFLSGGGVYLLLNAMVVRLQARQGTAGAGAWMVYAAVAADLVGDGLLIGAGAAVSTRLGLLLALGQVLADIPEGFAVVGNFRDKGVGRRRRLLLSASFVLPVLVAAALAFVALRGAVDRIQMMALVLVAGLYMLAAVEDMLKEAHESAQDTRWSAAAFLFGFALFLVASGSLG